MQTNKEGLTWLEWAAAAKIDLDSEVPTGAAQDWMNGVDPTEWAAANPLNGWWARLARKDKA